MPQQELWVLLRYIVCFFLLERTGVEEGRVERTGVEEGRVEISGVEEGRVTATYLLYTLSILPHLPPPFQFLGLITGSVWEELFTFDPKEIFSEPV